MKCYIGIDLGSTTTKAVYIDENEKLLGQGITNSRSNYDLACQIARSEAEVSSRFGLLEVGIKNSEKIREVAADIMPWLNCYFKLAQHLSQLTALNNECFRRLSKIQDIPMGIYEENLKAIFDYMDLESKNIFTPEAPPRSDFFRDIASSQYLQQAEARSIENPKLSFDKLIGIFDSAILKVENKNYTDDFAKYFKFASEQTVKNPKFIKYEAEITGIISKIEKLEFEILNTIGTGYGRQRLPFPKHQIRSEILCHGLGAHYMFPKTRTVLDIGGQDTKGIQVDENGIVTNFQMNDRCAAGCGRYLGYIADEMNVGVHELGPMAQKSTCEVKINSTCTVFAGAELRERLSLGEKREDILAGLHRSIILRAMSILARSGGIHDEFTFTGGVAKNEAAVSAIRQLVEANYGKMKINISPNSIYTGAIGAALFGHRDEKGELANVDLSKIKKKKPIEKNNPSVSGGK